MNPFGVGFSMPETEFSLLERLLGSIHKMGHFGELERIKVGGAEYPIYGVEIGSKDPKAPVLGLFAGVHGLESIGSEVVISFLEALVERSAWDQDLHRKLQDMRVVSIPIVNPSGLAERTRSNFRGVDIMRNAPIDAKEKVPFLIGGHRISPLLPYYRGEEGVLEVETKALLQFVKQKMFTSQVSLAIDVHSGFGFLDRLWYPHAGTQKPFFRYREVNSFCRLLERSLPNNVYRIEPQSKSYMTHGDLWDYLIELHEPNQESIFIPWTLEMGSWTWIRKNPRQLASFKGIFDPVKPHRRKRILRRHLALFDFFISALRNVDVWTKFSS